MIFKHGQVVDMLNGAVPTKAPFRRLAERSCKRHGAHLVPRFTLCHNSVFLANAFYDYAVLQLRAERLCARYTPLFLPGQSGSPLSALPAAAKILPV